MSTMFFRDPVGFSLKHPPTAKSKCPSFIAKVSLVGVERERDQVFIGNQREQLQKEPAEARSSHINPGGDAMRWALREYGTNGCDVVSHKI